MKKFVINDCYDHCVREVSEGLKHVSVKQDTEYATVTYEGLVSMYKTNKNGIWYLFRQGLNVFKKDISGSVTTEIIVEPVALFLIDYDLASRKKHRPL